MFDYISHAEQKALMPAIVVGCCILILLIWYALAAGGREERRIRRAVRRQGSEILAALEIPDGMDGRLFIDYLVLTADAIRVVVVKRYEGFIYAGEKLAEWTQVVKRNNYRFPNPLKELELKIIALGSIIPGIPITGCVLFSESCKFPTRQPGGVLRLGDPVPAYGKRPIPEDLQHAWRKLQQTRKDQ
ncbi:MAG TPA: nuclease-related domain-containing protein [Gammaproteobacteria bacterium]|nr:nuclease-related domain-containing protein [Gammaproteobacteria bacterium]